MCKSEWRSEEKDGRRHTHKEKLLYIIPGKLEGGKVKLSVHKHTHTHTHTHPRSSSDLILLDVFRAYTHFLVNIPTAPVVIAGFDAPPEEGLRCLHGDG